MLWCKFRIKKIVIPFIPSYFEICSQTNPRIGKFNPKFSEILVIFIWLDPKWIENISNQINPKVKLFSRIQNIFSDGVGIDSVWNSSECTVEFSLKFWVGMARIGSETDFGMTRTRGEWNAIPMLHLIRIPVVSTRLVFYQSSKN